MSTINGFWLVALGMMCYQADGATQNSCAPIDIKTSKSIIEQAQSGVMQQLLLQVDASVIFASEGSRRSARGLAKSDDSMLSETRSELAKLKAAVFPSGRRGNAVVLQNFSNFDTLLVAIPDYASLQLLLEDKRVLSIRENRVVTLPAPP